MSIVCGDSLVIPEKRKIIGRAARGARLKVSTVRLPACKVATHTGLYIHGEWDGVVATAKFQNCPFGNSVQAAALGLLQTVQE